MLVKTYSKRPKHLNLFKIKQPFPAVVSIIHRVTGVLLFFPGIPLLLCGFQNSVESPESFVDLREAFQNPLTKLVLLFPLWLFFHHLCAGIRYLALDLHIGIELPQARVGAYLVFAMGLLLTALTGWWLW